MSTHIAKPMYKKHLQQVSQFLGATLLCISALTLSATAKPITPGNDATREAALIMLEVQLRLLLAEENPALKFERDENSIVVNGLDFQTHISAEYDLVFVRSALSKSKATNENQHARYDFALWQHEDARRRGT